MVFTANVCRVSWMRGLQEVDFGRSPVVATSRRKVLCTLQ